MLAKTNHVRVIGEFFKKKKTRIFILVLAVGLVILGLGLSLQAGGGDLSELNHSGDLSYLQIKAEGATTIEYVVLGQPGMACDGEAFANGAVVANANQIGAAIVEDAATVGLCIRADYGYGNYLYEKYGDDLSFIRLAVEEQASESGALPPTSGLRVSIGSGSLDNNVLIASAEYVTLRHRSLACDAGAFADGDSSTVAHNQLIDLDYNGPRQAGGGLDSAQILCFRADYGSGNYVYEIYGMGSNIFFSGGTSKGALPGEFIFTDLTAMAPAAQGLHYVVFVYPGKSCSVRSFNIDADFITFSAPGYSELAIEAEVLESAEALCFRADFGDGLYTYQKYGGQKIEIEPRYKLTLSAEKEGGQLRIQSNTDVAQWQLVRSNSEGYFNIAYSLSERCGPNVVSFLKSPPYLSDHPDYDEKTWVIDLVETDYGRRYCIQARDNQGSVTYFKTGIIVSDLQVEIVQEGEMLKAYLNQAEAIDWQAVKTSGECSHFSFIARANQREELSFQLTRRDHNRFYCFRIKDKYGGYVLRLSPLINMATRPEITSVEQFDNIILAEAGEVLNKSLFYLEQWRIAKTDQPVCDEDALKNEITPGKDYGNYPTTQFIPLAADDVGHYFCFAIDYRGGFSNYRLSEQITTFENLQSDADGLQVEISQPGDFMIARANQDVHWYAFLVQDQNDCSAQGLSRPGGGAGGGGPEPVPSQQAYVLLAKTENDAYYCLRVRPTEQTEGDLYVVSPLIQDVEREDFRPHQVDYPYETPETINSGQDFADFLRPYLTDKGAEILDGVDEIFLDAPDAFAKTCGDAGACYTSWNRSIHLPWSGDYNDWSLSSKESNFNALLKTFLHEFMHATDYQDPEINGLSIRTWLCSREYSDDDDFTTGLNNLAFLQYTQCLTDSHYLFQELRDLYDDLPEDPEFDQRFANYRYLTNIHGRWSNTWVAFHRHGPSWYTELYAESIFIRDLPVELEEHYDQYFKNRSDIIDIYEISL